MEIPENRVTQILTKRAVLIGIAVATVVLIVIDIFLAVDDVAGNTWSELLRSAAKRTPVVPWLGGLVMGHWFHPYDRAEPWIDPPGNWMVTLLLTLLVAVLGFFVVVPPWVPVPMGAVLGALLWPVAVEERTLEEIQEAEA